MFRSLLLFGTIVLLPLTIMLNIQGRENFLVELSYFSIVVQSAWITFLSKGKGATLFKVYFVFSYIFYGIIPWLEYKFSIAYWGAPFYDANDRLPVNLALFSFNLIIFLVYRYSAGNGKNVYSLGNRHKIEKLNFLSSLSLLTLSLVATYITIYTNDFNVLLLVYRGIASEGVKAHTPLTIFLGSSVRFFSLLALIYIFYNVKKSYIVKYILVIDSLVSAFPLGIPRFASATLYLPFLLMFFPSLTYFKRFSLLLIGGIVYVFPFFNQFRWYKEGAAIQTSIDFSSFFQGHFDSYQSLLMAFDKDSITWGRQLLGVLFFYIPRAFWPSKPIGTGAELAKDFHLSFPNISANFYTEAYINFGLVGCFLFAFLLALVMAQLDKKMWFADKKYNFIDTFRPFYLLLLGYLFYILRGDLMSSVSFMISMLIPSVLISFILNFNKKRLFR